METEEQARKESTKQGKSNPKEKNDYKHERKAKKCAPTQPKKGREKERK
jgi:hypothetical protein